MNQATNDKHWLTRPTTIRRLWLGAAVVLLLTVVAQLLFTVKGHFVVDGWPGFAALFGFASCVAMVLVARVLGVVLRRDENYYWDGADDA